MNSLTPEEIESIHREIDGLNSHEQNAAVSALIGRSPEARRLYDQLEVISSALARIERVSAPDTLRPSILRAVASSEGKRTRGGARGYRWAPFRLGYAASFVLGILAVGVVSTVRNATDLTPADQMAGTLAPAARSQTVDSWTVASPYAKGTFLMVRRQGRPVVEFTVDSDRPIEVRLDCGSGCADMRGFVRRAGQETAVRSDNGRVTVATQGHYAAEVLLGDVAAGAATVRVLVTGAGGSESGTLRYVGS